MENEHCTTHETHIAHANSVAREIYLNYSPEKQNEFIRQLLKELTEKRQDGIHAAMKDIQFLSVNFCENEFSTCVHQLFNMCTLKENCPSQKSKIE
jgi:hypothetical protein